MEKGKKLLSDLNAIKAAGKALKEKLADYELEVPDNDLAKLDQLLQNVNQ